MQASVESFFMRPNAQRVRCLRIDAVLGPDYGDFKDKEEWHNAVNEVGRHPPSLGWLTPALRSACSLRLTFETWFRFSALSQMHVQARTTAALLSVCGTLETLHLHLEQMAILDAHRFRDVLPASALPASVRHLILQGESQICLPPKWSRLDAPEFRQLRHLVLRSNRLILQSLSTFDDHSPQRVTLEAGSLISVTGRGIGDVVQTAQELTASGCCLELRCPAQDCIGTDWSLSTALDPPKQQVDKLIEELRSWYFGTASINGS